MFKQLRTTLVTSYVGAIGLGWLFAQAILHFADVFMAPIVGALRRREYNEMMSSTHAPVAFTLQDALPELVKSLLLLLFGYLLLRWLYFKPLERETTDSASEPAQQS